MALVTQPSGIQVNTTPVQAAPNVSKSFENVAPSTNSSPTPSGAGNVTSSYPVVTSAPATSNYQSIQNDWTNNIQPAMQTAAANTQANAAAPVIDGYNVSPIPTGNAGETKLQQNGFTYYITPQDQNKPVTAQDIQNILSGGSLASDTAQTGTNGTTQVQNTTGGTNTGTTDTTTATPASTAQSQTGINPTTETNNYTSQYQQATDDLTQAAQTFGQTIQSIMSGSFPLSAAQQSLVDATNQAFNAMTSNANLKAAALSSETGGVSNKINAMGGELLNINSDQAAAIAKLEIGFQDQDYKAVTDAYSAYKDAETAKMDSLTKIHDAVMQTYNDAVKANEDAQAEADKQTELKQAAQKQADDETNAKITEGIDQEKANIEQDTYNAQYGSITNGSLVTPQSNGASIIIAPDGYKGNTQVVNGVPVVSKADAPLVSAAMNASSLLGKIQTEYNQLSQLSKSEGVHSSNYFSILNQYQADVKTFNGISTSLSSDPSFSGALSGVSLGSNPPSALGVPTNFSNIQGAINSGLSNKLPGYTPPTSGQLFTSPQSATQYFQSTGQTQAYNNIMTYADAYAQQNGLDVNGQAPDSVVLNFLNYVTPQQMSTPYSSQ